MSTTTRTIHIKGCEHCGHTPAVTLEDHRRAVVDAVEAAYREGITINVVRKRGGLVVSTKASLTEIVTQGHGDGKSE